MNDKFTAQDYRQLSEALEACGGDDAVMPDSYLDSIFDAARRFRDRYQICQERLERNGRQFDPTNGVVYWWCAQNMVWDDGVKPRDCAPETPHPDIGSGVCGWSLVVPEEKE